MFQTSERINSISPPWFRCITLDLSTGHVVCKATKQLKLETEPPFAWQGFRVSFRHFNFHGKLEKNYECIVFVVFKAILSSNTSQMWLESPLNNAHNC